MIIGILLEELKIKSDFFKFSGMHKLTQGTYYKAKTCVVDVPGTLDSERRFSEAPKGWACGI